MIGSRRRQLARKGATAQVLGWTPRGSAISRTPGLAARYSAKETAGLITDTGIKLWADKSGNSSTNAFVSDGAASNTATSPNVSTTGSRTFAFDVALTDYTPAADRVLVNKLSGNDGHSITLLTTGVVRLRVGNGASVTNVDSTAALSITDLARGQFTIVWTDGVGASFTQNGAALGTAVAAAVTMTNAAVANTLWALTAGVFYSYTCGTYNFIPSGAAKLATSFVAPTTGETWTINTSGVTGARISGARDLYQGTAANQPILTIAAAGNYLTWDGVNDYLKAAAFGLPQPASFYFVGTQETFTNADRIYDGNASASALLFQDTTTPNVSIFAGSTVGTLTAWALQTKAVIASVFNGASSSNRLNRTAAVTGNAGAGTPNGFTLGCNGAGSSQFGNITAQEVLVYSGAHDTATQNRIIAELGRRWGIAV